MYKTWTFIFGSSLNDEINYASTKNQEKILKNGGGVLLRDFLVKKKAEATIHHSNERSHSPSATRTFIFGSSLDNITIYASTKNQVITLKNGGGVLLRDFLVGK